VQPSRSSQGHILVVDDESFNRELLSRLLGKQGYEVSTVGSGEAALKALEHLSVDLVLLDVQLPGASGLEICERLKKAPETRLIPVALVTGLRAREDKIRGLRAGADDFIGKPFDAEELQARVASLIRLKQYTDDLDSAEGILRSLALTIEARDQYTDGHCERLARYSVALGRILGLPPEDLAALERGGYLHDIGKIGIPDQVLLKPGRLDAGELSVMKGHARRGHAILSAVPDEGIAAIANIVLHHHERNDGTGYPDGLAGDDIPLMSRLIALADSYDAMAEDRPYHAAKPHAQIMRILFEEEATRHDAALRERFAGVVQASVYRSTL
jgi:cyclic di-GMP phosphodiesterase